MRQLSVEANDARVIQALIRAEVRFMVIGGVAVKAYLSARKANDLDILIEPTVDTAEKTITALKSLDIRARFSPQELARPAKQIPIKGFPYAHDFDLLTPQAGVDFTSMYDRSQGFALGEFEVKVASIDDLIAAKENSGRPHDLEDINALKEIIERNLS